MIGVRDYIDEDGDSPFAKWFAALDATAAAKVKVGIVERQGEEWR